MIKRGDAKICPVCGSPLRLYDRVTRIVRSEYGKIDYINIYRYRCTNIHCHKIHRELPCFLIPYKQYKTSVIEGFIDGSLSSSNLEYEDYPTEVTVKKWMRGAKKT